MHMSCYSSISKLDISLFHKNKYLYASSAYYYFLNEVKTLPFMLM
jgi:hypothetical protein